MEENGSTEAFNSVQSEGGQGCQKNESALGHIGVKMLPRVAASSGLCILLLVCAMMACPTYLTAQVTITSVFTTVSMGNNCVAGPPSADFYTSYGLVWVWYQLQGGQQGDTGAVNWYGPSGTLEVSFPFGPASGPYAGTYCWAIAIGTGTPLGNWSVQLVTNGVINFSVPFTIGGAVINAPTTTVIDTPVALDGSKSVAGGGTIANYVWTVQNSAGGTDTLPGPTVNYQWNKMGTYSIGLTITDSSGSSGTASSSINVGCSFGVANVQPQTQQPDRCWATQGAIMLSWKSGQHIDGYKAAVIADKATGTTTFETDFKNGQMMLKDYTAFLQSLKIIQAAPFPPSACGVASRLQRKGPMTVVVGTPTTTDVHAEVLTAISGDGTLAGSSVTVIDPETGGTKIETFSMLLSEILTALRQNWPEFVQFQ